MSRVCKRMCVAAKSFAKPSPRKSVKLPRLLTTEHNANRRQLVQCERLQVVSHDMSVTLCP